MGFQTFSLLFAKIEIVRIGRLARTGRTTIIDLMNAAVNSSITIANARHTGAVARKCTAIRMMIIIIHIGVV